MAAHFVKRYIGIDVGAETVKVVELLKHGDKLEPGRKLIAEHHKEPEKVILDLCKQIDINSAQGAACTGRLGRLLNLERVPVKGAQKTGLDILVPDHGPMTIVSIGSHGFSVLEIRESGTTVFRENSRCSQGTGNFLRQLVERFNMTVEQASDVCAPVRDPAPLSGRCPVILKTDMTHLANKGEPKERILAGLYDAVCENVQVLIKPRLAPKKVLLVGGVTRAERIQNHFKRFLDENSMQLVDTNELAGEIGIYLEAFGAAFEAASKELEVPKWEEILLPQSDATFETLPGLKDSLSKVKRMTHVLPGLKKDKGRRLILGFDMGSTGSKVVALDLDLNEPVWETYRNTNGDPVGASQALMQRFIEDGGNNHRLVAFGATGSGREIVGSLLASCYGSDRVFVLNEIAAHAEGAMHYDPAVDTIFEIGGQDAKYARLSEGQVFDAAMNEACSAGTGSFIEEQGKKFEGVDNVVQLGQLALEAKQGISLGQHCSVFMAEVIDSAVSAGKNKNTIVAGIYDSIIQNYLNRVKGSRSVGSKVFCQGMPFSSDALAAAVVRQTGMEVVVPPNPGTVGALGIDLLAGKELDLKKDLEAADPSIFLEAKVLKKDTFVCRSNKGCGGSGNKCRIDRLTTLVAGETKKFLWGGNCSLYDSGVGRKKMPDRSPNPFRERKDLIEQIMAGLQEKRPGRPVVAMTDEFVLKNLFPFFSTFIHDLGFDIALRTNADHKVLKKGIEESNVPYCAPMQLYSGVIGELLEQHPDYLLLPMLRDLPRAGDEDVSTTCPLSQASADLLRHNLGDTGVTKILRPIIDMGKGNLDSDLFRESCRRMAVSLGIKNGEWKYAYEKARHTQEKFWASCLDIGRNALAFCKENKVIPIITLGRSYTIYNDVLNSNVPNLLREQGAMAIPVDCYPVQDNVPIFKDMYWGYSQQNLRAAHQIRRTPGVYSMFCSNYSCGPDSFNLHFYAYIMEGKPFAIIETDGHSGDAGTKTRIEAFLYTVETDIRSGMKSMKRNKNLLRRIEVDKSSIEDVRRREELLLIPRMGPGAEVLAAGLRAEGIRVESLPMANRDDVRIGRKHTSGKECVPMTITLGSVLKRIEQGDEDERYAFFMPTAGGPCRFGVYNTYHKMVFEKMGLKDRIRVVSQPDYDYFQGVSKGFAVKAWVLFMASDLLLDMMHDTRPVERRPGAAEELYKRYFRDLVELAEREPAPVLGTALADVPKDLFGTRPLLESAARAFTSIKDHSKQVPTVAMVGEIYVRCDPFANDFILDRLERRGIRVKFGPFNEWLEYTDWLNYKKIKEGRHEYPGNWFANRITSTVQYAVQNRMYRIVQETMGWPDRTRVVDSVKAASPYLSSDLHGEAILTLGGPVHEYKQGEITGVVSVGPLECMPSKVAQAQFFHAAEDLGLIPLSISVNGDSVDPEVLDNFVFEVKSRFEAQKNQKQAEKPRAGFMMGKPMVTIKDLMRGPMLPWTPGIDSLGSGVGHELPDTGDNSTRQGQNLFTGLFKGLATIARSK
ncbi:MAG: CoA activase [Deltaproteobacteria bacterium]|nr:CoA activase [Deltaproteobacteria bacterium]